MTKVTMVNECVKRLEHNCHICFLDIHHYLALNSWEKTYVNKV